MEFDVTAHARCSPGDFTLRAMPLQNLQAPAGGAVHLWWLQLSELAGSLKTAFDGPGKDGAGDSFTTGQLKFARRFYLRLLLGAYLGIPGKDVHITRNRRGKPVLDASIHNEPLHFSMAKSGDRLLLGLSTSHYLGVDLEPVARKAHNALGVASRYFSGAEYRELKKLRGGKREAAFLRAWACKEAVVKASGLGIANQLCRFTVVTDLDLKPAVIEFDGEPDPGWWLASLHPEKGYLGAVALDGEVDSVSAFRLLPAGGG